MLRVFCAVCSDVPMSELPGVVMQQSKQPGKSQKFAANMNVLNDAMQQYLIDNQQLDLGTRARRGVTPSGDPILASSESSVKVNRNRFAQITGNAIDNELDHHLHMFALDSDSATTTPDCDIYPTTMDNDGPVEGLEQEEEEEEGCQQQQQQSQPDDHDTPLMSAGDNIDDEEEDTKEPNNKSELDYYILGAFSALGVSELPLSLQVRCVRDPLWID